MQRGTSQIITHVHPPAILKQEAQRVCLAAPAGEVHDGLSVPIASIHLSPRGDQGTQALEVAGFDGVDKGEVVVFDLFCCGWVEEGLFVGVHGVCVVATLFQYLPQEVLRGRTFFLLIYVCGAGVQWLLVVVGMVLLLLVVVCSAESARPLSFAACATRNATNNAAAAVVTAAVLLVLL